MAHLGGGHGGDCGGGGGVVVVGGGGAGVGGGDNSISVGGSSNGGAVLVVIMIEILYTCRCCIWCRIHGVGGIIDSTCINNQFLYQHFKLHTTENT